MATHALKSEVCPSCGVPSFETGRSLGAHVFACPSCDLSFLSQAVRPASANDNAWYEDLEGIRAAYPTYLACMRAAYSHQCRQLRALSPKLSIADVGCGIGVFLSVARELGWDVTACELSPHAQRFLKDDLGMPPRDLSEIPAESLGAVRLSHVLEHIAEPVEALQTMHRVLAPRGAFLVIVPHREPLCAKIVNAARRVKSSLPELAGAIYPDMHVLGFNERSLTHLVESVGFEAQDVFSVGMGTPGYFPLMYDGLLRQVDPRTQSVRSLLKFWLPQLLDNVGRPFGLGTWVVGYFRKK